MIDRAQLCASSVSVSVRAAGGIFDENENEQPMKILSDMGRERVTISSMRVKRPTIHHTKNAVASINAENGTDRGNCR